MLKHLLLVTFERSWCRALTKIKEELKPVKRATYVMIRFETVPFSIQINIVALAAHKRKRDNLLCGLSVASYVLHFPL